MSKKDQKVVPCPNCTWNIPLPKICSKNSWAKCLRCEKTFGAYELYGLYQRISSDIKPKSPKIERIPLGYRECDKCGRVLPTENACRCILQRGTKLNPISGEPLPIEKQKTEEGDLNLYAEPEIEYFEGMKVIHSFIDESGWLVFSCEDEKGEVQLRRIRRVL